MCKLIKNHYQLLILLLFFLVPSLWAGDKKVTINKIVVIGNTKTKDVVITREMKSKPGSIFDENLLEIDSKRIQNLQLFTRVEIDTVFYDEFVEIVVHVNERWHVFPYPILYRNDKSWSKVSYGLGIYHDNVRGMKQFLSSSFWFGYNPGVDFVYSNPWIAGKHHLFYQIKAYSLDYRNRNMQYEEFDEKHQAISFTVGKRWGYDFYVGVYCQYRTLTVPKYVETRTLTETNQDVLPSFGFSIRYDKRDLYAYTKKGLLVNLYGSTTQNGTAVNYYRYGLGVRTFIPLYKDLSLALRGAIDLSEGRLPFYNHLYLGYSQRVRGHFETIVEGEQRYMTNAELRFPIIPVKYIDVDENFGQYGSNLPFGVSGCFFYDMGAVWLQDQTINEANQLKGFGFGLHFHVPYVEIFRLDYGFDFDGNGELIFDIGAMF